VSEIDAERRMARKLKTYVTSVGFFDLAIAAPSMKAALEAWGSNSNLFHQGFAKEVTHGPVVEATMAKPGVVLRRPVGSNKPFMEDAPLPANLPDERDKTLRRREPKARSPRKVDQEAARKAALAYEREERKRDAVRRKEEAAREKTRKHREQAVEKAQAALDKARHQHAQKAGAIAAERAEIEARAQTEEERWQKQKSKLDRALHRARS
jgi:colicin import membrane protein